LAGLARLVKMTKFLRILPFIILPGAILTGMYVWAVQKNADCPFFATVKSGADQARIEKSRADASLVIKRIGGEGEMELWETPAGQFWVPKSSASRFSTVIGEQQVDIYRAAEMVRPGDVVMDCGADVGTFTRTALRHNASKVIAVEPAPWKEPCLRRTFAREIEQGRVVIVAKGVWSEATTLKLDDDTIRTEAGIEVPLVKIDELAAELNLRQLDLIKMDIEGAEKPAILGGAATIRRFKPRFTIATEHKADDHSAILALLKTIDPSYSARCGPCVFQFGRVQPFTMQFEAH